MTEEEVMEDLNDLFESAGLEKITERDVRIPKLAQFANDYCGVWTDLYQHYQEYGICKNKRDEILDLSKLY